MEQDQKSIEEIMLTSNLVYVLLGLVVIAGLFEAWQSHDIFIHVLGYIDWAVVLIILAFGAITTLLLQAVMTPGAQTATNKRDFVIGRLMFWLTFLAFAIAVLLFLGPNGVLTYNRPDYNQYLILYKNQTTEVCGVIGMSYNKPVNQCFSFNGTDFHSINSTGVGPDFLNPNWSSQLKSFPSVIYKQ